jgi:hypothetical protein
MVVVLVSGNGLVGGRSSGGGLHRLDSAAEGRLDLVARAVFVEDEVAAFSDRPAGGAPAPVVPEAVFSGLSSSCR